MKLTVTNIHGKSASLSVKPNRAMSKDEIEADIKRLLALLNEAVAQ